jgi:hypothetical protein
MATALAVALRTTTSRAVPPPIYFGSWVSATPPVAGRTFTPVLVGHRPSDISWTLSCSVSVRDHSMAAHTQHFHQRTWAFEQRACSFYVPRGTAGSTLAVTVSASDSDTHTLDYTRGWRVLSHASMKTVPLGAPQPVVSFTKSFSDTPPVAGRAFMAAFVAQGTGGPWNFRCSATLHGRPVVVHRQEFGERMSVPDIRTCDLYVPRQAAGKLLGVTVDATTPNGQTLHATRGWHILGPR